MPATRRSTGGSMASASIHSDDNDKFNEAFGFRASDNDSDASEYGKRGSRKNAKNKNSKRTRKGIKAKAGHFPDPPDMSDDGGVDEEARSLSPGFGDFLEHQKVVKVQAKSSQMPSAADRPADNDDTSYPFPAEILQIHVNTGASGQSATINLNISDLVRGKRTFDVANATTSTNNHIGDDTTLLETATTPKPKKRKVKRAQLEQVVETRPAGFNDLPYELRVRVYRRVLVTESPIDFTGRKDFTRSSAFLATCSAVYDEGRAILYGENAFHFERSHASRGTFFEPTWKEIGFKDVRRFLEVIGPKNISLIRYVSFIFQDAAPSVAHYLDESERRYVNDPVLHHCLKMIGANASLHKIAFTFAGRAQVLRTDYHFLKALSTIKSQEVIHTQRGMGYHHSRMKDDLFLKLRQVMQKPKDEREDVDLAKKKAPTVKMFHEKYDYFRY